MKKQLKIGILIAMVLTLLCAPAWAMDYTEPLKSAVTVVSQGPEVTGMNYGLLKVVTRDGECYYYITDKGKYIRFKACEDKEWTDIYPEVDTSPEQ